MKRILGIDYGTRRIGLAVSDLLGITAQPLEVIDRVPGVNVRERLAEIVKSHQITAIVVGLPLSMDGSSSAMTEEARSFAEALGAALQIPIELYDERLTTLQAERLLTEEADMSREKRKKVKDKVAAALILQSYLDQHG